MDFWERQCSSSFVVNELEVGNPAESVQANSDGNEEIVLWDGAEDARNLSVDPAHVLRSHIVLAVLVHFADAADLSALLRDKYEPLIEWKVVLSLVDNLLNSVFWRILIDVSLDLQLLEVLVLADTKFWQVPKLCEK